MLVKPGRPTYELPLIILGDAIPIRTVDNFNSVVRVIHRYVRTELQDVRRKIEDRTHDNTVERYHVVRRHLVYWAQVQRIEGREKHLDILLNAVKSPGQEMDANVRFFRSRFNQLMTMKSAMEDIFDYIQDAKRRGCSRCKLALESPPTKEAIDFLPVPPFSLVPEMEEIDYGLNINSDDIEAYL